MCELPPEQKAWHLLREPRRAVDLEDVGQAAEELALEVPKPTVFVAELGRRRQDLPETMRRVVSTRQGGTP